MMLAPSIVDKFCNKYFCKYIGELYQILILKKGALKLRLFVRKGCHCQILIKFGKVVA